MIYYCKSVSMFCIRPHKTKPRIYFRSNSIYSKFRKILALPGNLKRKLSQSKFTTNFNNYFGLSNQSNKEFNFTDADTITKPPIRNLCSKEEKHQEISCIHCKDSLQHVYQILFTICNVKIFPISFATRDVTDFENDKQTFTLNKIKFKEVFDFKSNRLWVTNRLFYLVKGHNKVGCVTGIKDVNPIKIYREKPKSKYKNKKDTPIGSIHRYPQTVGQIIIVCKGVVFHLNCKLLHLDSIRNRLVDHGVNRYPINETYNLQNQAIITAKYKNDLIRFKFDMCNVTIQPVVFKISRACQVVDSNRFIPYFNEITNRRVFIPIPRSTVDYTDPMEKLRRRSLLKNFDPKWLKNIRIERIKKPNCKSGKLKNNEPKVIMTLLSAENGGIVYKIRAGMLKVNSVKNAGKYESFVISHQRKIVAKKWEKIRFYEKPDTLIPDWNLERHEE